MSKELTTKWEIPNGAKVRDIVSGLVGVVTCRLEYLNGCLRYSVQPPVDKDGKMPEGYTFDEAQLELVPVENPVQVEKRGTGGDRDTPQRPSVPVR